MAPPPAESDSDARLVPAYGLYYLDNQPLVLRAGHLPYWRVPAGRWADGLEGLRAAGCNAVLLSVPWAWHAPAPGQTDLRGGTLRERDLAAFLDLAQRAGLVANVAPGPTLATVQPLAPASGYPRWIAEAVPEALARRPDGRPATSASAPRFSLLHPAYLARVEAWYTELADVIRPLQNAPVVAWHLNGGLRHGVALDRATATRVPGGRTSPGLSDGWAAPDFNPDTVARYRAFLAERYISVRLMAREWRRDVAGFEAVLPPRDQRSHGELADWQAFREALLAEYLGRLRDLVRGLGISVPLAAEDAAHYTSPHNPRLRAAVVDLYGYTVDADGYYADGAGSPSRSYRAELPNGPLVGPCAGPFSGSQAALRFEPFSTEERPLTCWWAGTAASHLSGAGVPAAAEALGWVTLHTIVGGLAHGLKGYAIGFDGAPFGPARPASAGRGGEVNEPSGAEVIPTAPGAARPSSEAALARLQHWLESAAEELTASVEVRDALAYLDYQPYSRRTPDDVPTPIGQRWRATPSSGPPDRRFRYGLHALLLTCGYNPSVVDLQHAPDAELLEYPAAVFPSLGYLAVEDYGKLVVFTLRGGSLVTFPEPATRQADGTPLNTQFLWPHRGDDVPPLTAAGGALGRLWRPWRPWGQRLLGRLPWHVLGRARDEALPTGTELKPWEGGGTVRGDGRLLTFPDAGRPVVRYGRRGAGDVPRAATETLQAQVLLSHAGLPAAYRVQVRSGTSTVLGTWLGGAYATPHYASLTPEARLGLRRFALRLFHDVVPRQLAPQERLELETVARLSPDGGCLLFVINRLGPQSGWIHFPAPSALNLGTDVRAAVLYSAAGSRAEGGTSAVRLDVEAGDVLVVRLR